MDKKDSDVDFNPRPYVIARRPSEESDLAVLWIIASYIVRMLLIPK